jgi:hypothetical protein
MATEKITLEGGVLIGYHWYARKAMGTCAAHQTVCIKKTARSVVKDTFES